MPPETGSGAATKPCRVERFPLLAAIGGLEHGFIGRVPGVDVRVDREEAMRRLASHHTEALDREGLGAISLATAEQTHGDGVACIFSGDALPAFPIPGVDALLTDRSDLLLGIYVADCAAVYLADIRGRACGMVHSGKRGTESGIVTRAIELLQAKFGVPPQDLAVQISPCIRPPLYEVDFAKEIARQVRAAGGLRMEDCLRCTGSDLTAYYSYRIEKGETGRMLAYMGRGATGSDIPTIRENGRSHDLFHPIS